MNCGYFEHHVPFNRKVVQCVEIGVLHLLWLNSSTIKVTAFNRFCSYLIWYFRKVPSVSPVFLQRFLAAYNNRTLTLFCGNINNLSSRISILLKLYFTHRKILNILLNCYNLHTITRDHTHTHYFTRSSSCNTFVTKLPSVNNNSSYLQGLKPTIDNVSIRWKSNTYCDNVFVCR